MEEVMFIEKVKELLKEKGITKNKLLTDLQLGKNSFVNWESRGTVPSGEVLAKIANYFGVSVDYLLGNEEQKAAPASEDAELAELLEELKTRPEMKMLFSVTKGATKADVEKAVNIIKALRESENG